MKKLIIAALVLFAVATVSAHTDHSSHSIANATVTADHPMYDTKMAIEKQIESLAPNDTARAQAKIERAETRIGEINTLVAENKTDLVNQTSNNYSEEMQNLQNFSDQISDQAQKRNIDELVANATKVQTEALSRVYERVPEQAKAGIKNALNKSVTGHQKAIQSLNQTGGIPEGMKGTDIGSMVPEDIRGEVGQDRREAGSTSNTTSSQESGSQDSQTTSRTR